jgi:Lon protease-like protein
MNGTKSPGERLTGEKTGAPMPQKRSQRIGPDRMGKKGTKKHHKALDDIDRLHGTDQFETAVKAYVDQYGLPEDWSTLSLLLDYSDPDTVAGAIQAMKPFYESRSLMEQQGFKAKLDILAMTTRNSDLRDVAEEMLKAL